MNIVHFVAFKVIHLIIRYNALRNGGKNPQQKGEEDSDETDADKE